MKQPGNGLFLKWLELTIGVLVPLSLGKKIEGNKVNRLDIYIISWIAFEVIVLLVLAFIDVGNIAVIILVVLLSYHLFEIGVTSFNSVIISPIKGEKHRSVPRLFSLILADYIEVILIFGIFFNILIAADTVLKSLHMSVSLATLAGASLSQESDVIFIASIAEMSFAIFFVAGAIATISNYLGSKE